MPTKPRRWLVESLKAAVWLGVGVVFGYAWGHHVGLRIGYQAGLADGELKAHFPESTFGGQLVDVVDCDRLAATIIFVPTPDKVAFTVVPATAPWPVLRDVLVIRDLNKMKGSYQQMNYGTQC